MFTELEEHIRSEYKDVKTEVEQLDVEMDNYNVSDVDDEMDYEKIIVYSCNVCGKSFASDG